jgi:hypothetical protein
VNRVTWVSLDPRYQERFAFISRASGGMSPATKRFMELAGRHMAALRERAASWNATQPEHGTPRG